MKFKKITEAHKNFGQLVQLIESDREDVVLVRNGKPCVLVRWIDEDELEDYIVAKHFGVEKLAKAPRGKTTSLDEVEKNLGLRD